MADKLEKLQNLLQSSRLVDFKTLEVDQGFKDDLREKLYTLYINEQSQGGGIMARIKSIQLNWKFGLMSFVVLALVALVAGGGALIFTSNQSGTDSGGDVLLAANLAVAEGDVDIKKSGEDRWMEALQGDTLKQGDSIKTAEESRAVIILDNGDALRLNAESEVTLTSLKPEAVLIDQANGETYSRVTTSEENTYTVRGQGVEAQALGTAYTFKSAPKAVTISVLESIVKVNYDANEEQVNELKKLVVNTEEKTVNVKDMEEEEYNDEFVKWNKTKDEELGYEYHEKDGPVVTITAPPEGKETEGEKIAVKGKVADESALRKIKVNGKIYTSKNNEGKGFDPSDGTFNVDVSLSEGKNTITVIAYDVYWNMSEKATIVVTRNVPESDPVPTSSFYISSISSPAAGKIYAKWVVNGISTPHGFKIVWSKTANPVYPGNDYKYLSDSGARELTWSVSKGATYYVRVCVYNGSGQCLQYTPNKTVTVGDVAGASDYRVKLSWSSNGNSSNYPTNISLSAGNPFLGLFNESFVVSNVTTPNGYKVCWDTQSDPTYPADTCKYIGGDSSNYTTSGLVSGKTYHFRVCAYNGSGCELYSNNVSKTMP